MWMVRRRPDSQHIACFLGRADGSSLYGITIEELSAYRAWLAIIIGLSTDIYEITEIADEIFEVIKEYDAQNQTTKGHED